MTLAKNHINNQTLPPYHFKLGLDIGSTTAKIVLLNADNEIIQSAYHRHRADITGTLVSMLEVILRDVGDIDMAVTITGSAGMGVAERTDINFIQEVVASSKAVRFQFPDTRMLIDIGGEDSKMIFFDEHHRPDMRMNGNCAGGTGAFLDQMASLLDIPIEEFGELAKQAQRTHTIASRCGVFAKTDIQNLLNSGVDKAEIARSVFYAIALQAINSLARGKDTVPPAVFVGGPLYYFEVMREAFLDTLKMSEEDATLPEESRIYPAFGAALSVDKDETSLYTVSEFISILQNEGSKIDTSGSREKLFENKADKEQWLDRKRSYTVPVTDLADMEGDEIFLGIDAGSTTTKIIATDQQDDIVFRYYTNNKGAPVESVKDGLKMLIHQLDEANIPAGISRSMVTGYGEELIKSAFAIDDGMVETLAHYCAAQKLEPDVSFILDIGGQDIKAIFIRNGIINNIEVNEACSSGCGSFISTFADTLGYPVEEFGEIACNAEHPVNLGSRCTVFMNSSVKECLRQGRKIEDIAAGLSYSVIGNCLHKVLEINNISVLGNKVVVQGGTFKNPSVLRAFEKSLGFEVIRPGIAEYMGAYGAAITAHKNAEQSENNNPHNANILNRIENSDVADERKLRCKACSFNCEVRRIEFKNGRDFYTGQRCGRVYSNSSYADEPGENLFDKKLELLFAAEEETPENARMTVGIPMVLNMYENYPFWSTLFQDLGFEVVRSNITIGRYLKYGAGTVMSENICFPAKLTNGHILDLIKKNVDRIFFPEVVYEQSKFDKENNHFNCPIVTGYPEVIKNTINPDDKGIPFDYPQVSFSDSELLEKGCWSYLEQFDVSKTEFAAAFDKALQAMDDYKSSLKEAGKDLINRAKLQDQSFIVLAGRPYHADPIINHKIPEMIAKMGVHVIPQDALPLEEVELPESLEVFDQWEYSNQLYRAAHWVGTEPKADFVQLNSFGCGPDAITVDEVKDILKMYGKSPLILKIDEISSTGSAKLRIRSLLESRQEKEEEQIFKPRKKLPAFKKEDRRRTILAPEFSPVYSLFIESIFRNMGYNVEILRSIDKESEELGLKWVNNDICYPAILVIGEIVKALESGRYNPDDIAVGLTATGGQCRASNYLSILKKALLNAGYDNIPVVTIALNKEITNYQPGFSLNRPKLISLAFSGLLVVDQLIRMHHATAVREIAPGSSKKVLKHYLNVARQHIGDWTLKKGEEILADAVAEFNAVSTHTDTYPKAGIVGEIYVKYNPFSNGNIVEKLQAEGIEVSVPPLYTFFLQSLVNKPYNNEKHIKRAGRLELGLYKMLRKYVDAKIHRSNEIMSDFKLDLKPLKTVQELSGKAKKIVNISNQFGEGWLLPAEVVDMAESGIMNIISLQPFGCIANHIVAKSIQKILSDLYPGINYLSLDLDSGNSEVNVQNRLAFFIHNTLDAAGSAASASPQKGRLVSEHKMVGLAVPEYQE